MDKILYSEGTRNTIFAYNEFTEIPNTRNPTEVPGDIMVQIKSVREALMECIEKIKISAMMPMIFAKSKIICQILDNSHYQECSDSLRDCIEEMSALAQPSRSFNQNIRLSRAIDVFQNNSQVLNIIGHLFIHEDIVDTSSTISAWNVLLDLVNKRMYKDPRKELEQERILHKIYWENNQFIEYYKKFLFKTLKGRNKLHWRIAAKEAIVSQIENEFVIDKARRQGQFRIAERIAMKKLQETQKATQIKARETDEELQKAKDAYNKTVRDNNRTEMDVRAERNKLMLQLQALLRRYDTVMLEKKKTIFALNEKLKRVQDEFDEFYKFYLKKEAIHLEIERKREEEFQARVEFFTHTRAAKIIQKAWKRFIKIVRKERAAEAKSKQKKK